MLLAWVGVSGVLFYDPERLSLPGPVEKGSLKSVCGMFAWECINHQSMLFSNAYLEEHFVLISDQFSCGCDK